MRRWVNTERLRKALRLYNAHMFNYELCCMTWGYECVTVYMKLVTNLHFVVIHLHCTGSPWKPIITPEKIVKFPASAELQRSLLSIYTPRNSILFTATTNSFQTSYTILLLPTAILDIDSAKWLPFFRLSDEIS